MVLKVGDKKGLEGFGEDNWGDGSSEIGDLCENLSFFERNEEDFSLKTNTQ